MNISSRLIVSTFAIFGFGSANASAISNGAYTQFVIRDCRSASVVAAGGTTPDLCVGTPTGGNPHALGRVVEQGWSSAPGLLSAQVVSSSQLATSNGKITSAYADAGQATPNVVQLGVGAFSIPYSRASASADAMQSFYFDGTGPTARTLRHSVSFTATNPLTYSDFLDSPIAATSIDSIVWVFSLDAASFEFPTSQEGGTFVSAAQSFGSDFRLEASRQDDFIDGTLSYDLAFNMEAGRYYFVESYMFVVSKFAAPLDGLHTFNAELGVTDVAGNFSGSLEGLTPAQPIPEPGKLALSLLGLGVLGALRLFRRCDN